MILGKNGKWMWLSSKAAYMGDLVEKRSQILIDKFVLITSLDSGFYRLDDELIKSGWKYVGRDADDNEGEFALSPRITNPAILPRVHYDEWYVFNSPPKLEIAEVFINLVDFGFSIGHIGLQEMEPCNLEERFWDQLNVINPFAYMADNGSLLFATPDGSLYEQVVLAVQDEERQVETACDARSTLGES